MTIKISMFGCMNIMADGSQKTINLPPRVASLLCYVVLADNKSRPREIIVETLWPNLGNNRGSKCLNTTMWRLKTLIGTENSEQTSFICTNSMQEIFINNNANIWVDVDDFRNGLSNSGLRRLDHLSPEDLCKMEYALTLYKGQLLEGFYEDWAIEVRESLHRQYLDCLMLLGRHYRKIGDLERSIVYLRNLLRWDLLREDVHYELIIAYLKNGQRRLALQQYKLCQQALSSELDIEPCAEFKNLLHQILEGIPNQTRLTCELNTGETTLVRELLISLQQCLCEANSVCKRLLLSLDSGQRNDIQ